MADRFSMCVTLLALFTCRVTDSVCRAAERLNTEVIAGDDIWIDPRFEKVPPRIQELRATVWFDRQFLSDGAAWRRRTAEFSSWKRRDLRSRVVQTLKEISQHSWQRASTRIESLIAENTISSVEPHWIVNGFSCTVTAAGVQQLKSIPNVRRIFLAGRAARAVPRQSTPGRSFPATAAAEPFDAGQFLHPWYSRSLLADRVWTDLKVTGGGTLNVIHDFNFVFSENVTSALYQNAGEIPDNGKDDDGNGLVDDYHGYNFDRGSHQLTMTAVDTASFTPQAMHGFMCAAIVSGRGSGDQKYEFGIAPRSTWAGLIAGPHLEAAIEWAVEHQADTYSMSFSRPGLGDYRSHWRKVMEHGSFCGVCFVSGAGNYAQQVPIPVQMRIPEDIPGAVFAAAGVQRDLSKTPFSSQGPVEWQTRHYQDGRVLKPEVCGFNMGLPGLRRNGTVTHSSLNGNSFAGPMFCGAIALMLSADPDLLPWDLRDIITRTATDIGPDGFDGQTGHGLINCYRSVREVLRRKAVREQRDAAQWSGRTAGDELDMNALRTRLKRRRLRVMRLQPGGQAARAGLKPGDIMTAYNGQTVSSGEALKKARAGVRGTDSVPIRILRGTETLTFQVKPGPPGLLMAPDFMEPVFR